MIDWLVVSTPLKNISQLGWLFPIYGKIKNVPNHQPNDIAFWILRIMVWYSMIYDIWYMIYDIQWWWWMLFGISWVLQFFFQNLTKTKNDRISFQSINIYIHWRSSVLIKIAKAIDLWMIYGWFTDDSSSVLIKIAKTIEKKTSWTPAGWGPQDS